LAKPFAKPVGVTRNYDDRARFVNKDLVLLNDISIESNEAIEMKE